VFLRRYWLCIFARRPFLRRVSSTKGVGNVLAPWFLVYGGSYQGYERADTGPLKFELMREHQELLSTNRPNVGQAAHGVSREAVPVATPRKGRRPGAVFLRPLAGPVGAALVRRSVSLTGKIMKQTSGYCPHCERKVLATAPTPNHVLHLLMTIFTCGCWLFVWPIVMAACMGGYRCVKCGTKVEKTVIEVANDSFPVSALQ